MSIRKGKEGMRLNMNILRNLTIKNLKLNKTRTIATILGIVLLLLLQCIQVLWNH